MKVKNQSIEVTANQKQKTFTIRKFINGKLSVKYRTVKLSKDEFESNLNNTENDWIQFLKTDSYYLVK